MRFLILVIVLSAVPPALATTQETRSLSIRRSQPVAPSIETGDYYALFIAVEQYDHNCTRFPTSDKCINNLDNPIADARRVRALLEQQYTFEPKNVTFLENPNREEILDEFARLETEITSEDSLLIFYAGHGYWNEDIGQGYWLPRNAQKGRYSGWISNADVRDSVALVKSKHTLLVADACFSGGIFKTRAVFGEAPADIASLHQLPSRTAMTAGQGSMEVPDRSVFIEYLVKKLDANEDKYVSASSVFQQLRGPAISNAPLENLIPQHGVIHGTGDEDGDFIFVRRGGGVSSKPVAQAPLQPVVAASPEVVFWNSIDGSDDPALYEAYLNQYPDGSFVELVKVKLQRSGEAQAERDRAAREEAAQREADQNAELAAAERRRRGDATRNALSVLGLAPALEELAGLDSEPEPDPTVNVDPATTITDSVDIEETGEPAAVENPLGQLLAVAITKGAERATKPRLRRG